MPKKIILSELTKLIATYELPEIEPADPEEAGLKFTVQILLNQQGKYFPRVLRWECFNLSPTYLPEDYRFDEDGQIQLYMEECLIRDYSADWEAFECDTEEEALMCVLDELENQGLSINEDDEDSTEDEE